MDVNQATIDVTGVGRDQLIGSDFSNYFTEPDQARTGYQQVFSQGYVTDYPLAIRHVSGKVTEVLYNASVYRNAQGEVAGIFAAARDVTGTKRIEAELRQSNADLESFSYSVSHDLRAPLRAIDGFATILREDYAAQLDTEGQRLFQVVSDNAKKMGQLIEDILFLSRASRHEMLINRIDIKALAQEVWDGLTADRTGRDIDFRLADLPSAYADTAAMREVLQNLLGNAIKFTRGRKPAVIEMAGTVEGKENIYFVRDNGVGFDTIYTNKLFCLFQRLHSMTEFEGTGVGLAIVKRFIIKHGGRVCADGKPGEGATFWFTLPIQQHVEPKYE
jgi:two-component system sensor kinase